MHRSTVLNSGVLCLICVCPFSFLTAQDASLASEAKSLKPGVTLTLIAEHPDVATPTGIDVDADRNVWVLSCHTHFRPDDYEGPEHDEVVVFNADATSPASNGPARRVFYSKTTATMDLELGPDGWVYLAERDRILRVKDTDNDGIGDVEETIVTLITEEDYPHNGLSGLAWESKHVKVGPRQRLLFTLGENYWKPWELVGRDGKRLTGTGEGGVFEVTAEGRLLKRVARGFWNPFGITVHNDGSMFVCENDPGARPPCRLLHVVQGGDYGYQRAYGRAPSHPFVCWNGELRGTLPMLHATGEAPCGIAPIGGGLLVTSWADHRIDFFPLTRKGESFETERIELVTGSDVFRPTGLVRFGLDRFASPLSPDDRKPETGSNKPPTRHTFYFADWVEGSYEIHGKGRVWKLEVDQAVASEWLQPQLPAGRPVRMPVILDPAYKQFHAISPTSAIPMLERIASPETDPFQVNSLLEKLSRRFKTPALETVRSWKPSLRLATLLVEKRRDPTNESWPRLFLEDSDPEVRFEALRWIADANLRVFLPDAAALLTRNDISYREFEAALACWNTISGNPRAGISEPATLLPRVLDADAPATIRAYALRLLPPTHKGLSTKVLSELADSSDEPLSLEAVHSLASRSELAAYDHLLAIGRDVDRSANVRATAIAGLTPVAHEIVSQLFAIDPTQAPVKDEVLRALRFGPKGADVGAPVLRDPEVSKLREEAETTTDERLRAERLKTVRRLETLAAMGHAIRDAEYLKQNRPPVTNIDAWLERLEQFEGNVESGERIFHHSKVGFCAKCHQHTGRGNVVGPDLSAAGGGKDSKRRLLTAILQPHKDVDPQFYPWTIVTTDGQTFSGIPLRKGGRSGKEFYRDTNGQERAFLKSDIEFRKELKTSLMPEGLVFTMTDQELADVLAFLESSKVEPAPPVAADDNSTAGSDTESAPSAALSQFAMLPEAEQWKLLEGEWGFDFPDGYGGWMEIKMVEGTPLARVLWRVGSARPLSQVALLDGRLSGVQKRGKRGDVRYFAGFTNVTESKELDTDRIALIQINAENEAFPVLGRRLPPMPPKPDLSKVKFGTPKQLFNGKDLHGWHLHPEKLKNGWSVQDEVLTNSTPKKDFSAYGEHGNLRTVLTFGDCQLHIEFNVPLSGNSGIYVRGLYECQVTDRDSRMQGIAGVGSIFGRVERLKNVGKPGGEWQAYDITLVDRHMTVVLNGEKVVDNQPVPGCTGGSIMGDVTRKGPLLLQGDHTSVKYRNIVIRERIGD